MNTLGLEPLTAPALFTLYSQTPPPPPSRQISIWHLRRQPRSPTSEYNSTSLSLPQTSFFSSSTSFQQFSEHPLSSILILHFCQKLFQSLNPRITNSDSSSWRWRFQTFHHTTLGLDSQPVLSTLSGFTKYVLIPFFNWSIANTAIANNVAQIRFYDSNSLSTLISNSLPKKRQHLPQTPRLFVCHPGPFTWIPICSLLEFDSIQCYFSLGMIHI